MVSNVSKVQAGGNAAARARAARRDAFSTQNPLLAFKVLLAL